MGGDGGPQSDPPRAERDTLDAMIEAALSQTHATPDRRVIFVDGFNVLHAVLEGQERETAWWRRRQRERLLARTTAWPDAQDEIWVAFDGPRPAWSVWAEPVAKRVTPAANPPSVLPPPGPIVHSLFVEDADDWIVRRARRTSHPERTIVVSRDRRVAGRARSAGCVVWSPGEFLARCPSVEPTASSSSGESAGE